MVKGAPRKLGVSSAATGPAAARRNTNIILPAGLMAPSPRIHHFGMQPPDRVQRRGHRTFLPSRQARGMLIGQQDAAIQGAEIVVMLNPARFRPGALASHGPRHAMPGHR